MVNALSTRSKALTWAFLEFRPSGSPVEGHRLREELERHEGRVRGATGAHDDRLLWQLGQGYLLHRTGRLRGGVVAGGAGRGLHAFLFRSHLRREETE